jgi:hypothetical protein
MLILLFSGLLQFCNIIEGINTRPYLACNGESKSMFDSSLNLLVLCFARFMHIFSIRHVFRL